MEYFFRHIQGYQGTHVIYAMQSLSQRGILWHIDDEFIQKNISNRNLKERQRGLKNKAPDGVGFLTNSSEETT